MIDEEGFIAGEISAVTGELMLSAADVVAWLRDCAESTTNPRCGRYVDSMADHLASRWIDASAEAMERGES